MNYEWLIAAGLLVGIMDIDRFKQHDSWLFRYAIMRRWSETEAKFLFWPLDLWHIAKMAALYCVCRAFVGWWEAALAAGFILTVFTFAYHFVWRLVPFRALWEWLRNVPNKKQDAYVG